MNSVILFVIINVFNTPRSNGIVSEGEFSPPEPDGDKKTA